jgi:antitoxin (DNA-binding transcriptional repressor) of toxin-antitoxin stability system
VLRSPSSLSSLLSSSPPPASGLIYASTEIPVLRLTPLRNRDSGVWYGGTGTGNLLSPSSSFPLLSSSPPPVLSGTGTQLQSPSPPPASGVICASAEIPVLRLTPLRLRNRDSYLLATVLWSPSPLS